MDDGSGTGGTPSTPSVIEIVIGSISGSEPNLDIAGGGRLFHTSSATVLKRLGDPLPLSILRPNLVTRMFGTQRPDVSIDVQEIHITRSTLDRSAEGEVTGVTGSVAMMRTLLPARPDLKITNRFGGTSLIPAAERGHVDYVRALLRETDVDVDHVNRLGWTALLEAVILGDGGHAHQEIVELLITAGAAPDLPDSDGRTALEHAERRGFREIAGLLRAAR